MSMWCPNSSISRLLRVSRSVRAARRPVLSMACLAVAMASSPAAHALGMGEATTRSHVGQALRIEIPLQLAAGESPAPSCFQVVPGVHEDDGIPWILNGRTSIEGSGASTRLVLRTPATDAPAVRLAVRAACGVNLRREYALLLEPPLNVDSVPAVASEETAAPQRSRASQVAQRTDAPSAETTVTPRRTASSTRSSAPRHPAVAQNGAARVRPAPAPAHETSPAPATAQAPASAPKAAPRDQLVVGPTSADQLAASLPPNGASSPVRSTHGRTEAELISELDDRIAQQIALTERLRRLEQLQTELAADNARLETQVRQLRQNSGAVNAVGPVVSNSDSPLSQRWPYAVVAALCLLAAWLIKRRKDRPTAAALSEGPHTVRLNRRYKGPATEEEDDVFAPLTERDLWPERSSLVPLPIADSVTESLEPILSIPSKPDVVVTEDIEEHDSAVELAEIMMSFGRIQGAAQTLADFIRANPKQAVKPWIKLLEVYHSAGMRTEFDGLSAQINKTFNIQPVTWEDFEVALRDPASIESMTHIRKRLCESWNTRECQAYLHALLRDNRDGTRQGFPLVIVDEILMLLGVLEQTLGHFRYEPPAPTDAQPTPQLPEAGQTTLPMSDTQTQLETWVDEVPELPIEIPPAGAAHPLAQPNPFAGNLVDLDIDGQDFGKTLHFNLDELDGHTRPVPELNKKQA